MLIYLGVYFSVFLLTFFAQNIKSDFDKNKKKAKLLIFIILVFLIYVILVLPSVFRYGIGLDYFGDLNTITNYKLTGTFARTELITALFGKIVYEYLMPEGKDVNDLTEDEFNKLTIINSFD